MRPKQQIETFPDGIAVIYQEQNRQLGEQKGIVPFEEQSVGITRYYTAQTDVSSSRIDQVIKVPRNAIANRMDIVIIKGSDKQYRINRIQRKPERGVDLWELQSVQVSIKRNT